MERQALPHRRLAEGEVTGHYHEALAPDAVLYQEADGGMTLSAPNGTEVRHQEHGPLLLPPNQYRRELVREYDHFAEEARAVRD